MLLKRSDRLRVPIFFDPEAGPSQILHGAAVSIRNDNVDDDGARLCLECGLPARLRLCCLAVQYLAEHENEAERGDSERKGDR